MMTVTIPNRMFSVAPMMNCTDRHDRYFLRLISPHAWLYTEMLTTNALMHGDAERFLAFDPLEHPVALQLGGCEPESLAYCAKLGATVGYDEINLNVGCPSDRVKKGRFGACLMQDPLLVADCVRAMTEAVLIPVTVKCRIGVDHLDSYEALTTFIDCIHKAGCNVFIIHARKAWLNGLSPKQNRDKPPLRYDIVRKVKQDFPHLTIVINGGIKNLMDIGSHLKWVDGVMIGREAYSNPYFLAEIEKKYYPSSKPILTRHEVIEKLLPYMLNQCNNNVKLSRITRHILGLFHGEKGARIWRRSLSENQENATIQIIKEALQNV